MKGLVPDLRDLPSAVHCLAGVETQILKMTPTCGDKTLELETIVQYPKDRCVPAPSAYCAPTCGCYLFSNTNLFWHANLWPNTISWLATLL